MKEPCNCGRPCGPCISINQHNDPTLSESEAHPLMTTTDTPTVTHEIQTLRAIRNSKVAIPEYQRSYCWSESHVRDLLSDISTIQNEYRMGTIILYENQGKLEIVDGQQRLVTLEILLFNLGF